MSLDPDDPRPPYQQVANALRAAILTRKLAPGEKLPSGNELASRYGVARMTIQQAIRLLRDEGLIVSRRAAGSTCASALPATAAAFTAPAPQGAALDPVPKGGHPAIVDLSDRI